MITHRAIVVLALCWGPALLARVPAAEQVTYDQIAPTITRYCAGCHNESEANGDLALDSYRAILAGGASGPALTAGSAQSSRMIQALLGKLEPVMPPDGEPAPEPAEVERLIDWINSGARGPDGKETLATQLRTPELPPAARGRPITAIAFAPDETVLAAAQFGRIRLLAAPSLDSDAQQVLKEFAGLPGKVTALRFTSDGKYLVAGTGVTGLYGEASLWRVSDGKQIRQFRGHRDMVYALDVSQDGRWLVTAGYDRKAVLWDLDSAASLVEFVGHNAAIFDVALDAAATVLATASGDGTVKVWRVSDGVRLDTRGEPLKDQLTTAISPDGDWIVAAGADNRIRKWRLVSRTTPQINPLQLARFAHETPIQCVRFSPDGTRLVSVAAGGELKLWDAETLHEIHRFEDQPASVQAIAVSSRALAVGRMDGTLAVYRFPARVSAPDSPAEHQFVSVTHVETEREQLAEAPEVEPNDDSRTAPRLTAPFRLNGVIDGAAAIGGDIDLVRFAASAGQTWIIEAQAAEGSPLDTRIAVLDEEGQPVPRVLLQAVRDSYFTFRGKDSFQINDFRIHNWEEMQLNQYLYCNGEVVKLYHYPRGPDSGFNVFPNSGSRHTFFDTTALAHALHEPCYIVQPHPPGTPLKANGLPTFLLNYENDDDSEREWGSNSRLTFTSPDSGEYIVRVGDARGFEGKNYRYTLTVRRPQPDFAIRTIHGENPKVLPGSGRRIGVEIDRVDGFAGEVRIEFDNLPKGFTVAGPLSIEPEQLFAWTALYAPPVDNVTADVAPDSEESQVSDGGASESKPRAAGEPASPALNPPLVTGIAMIDGREVRRSHPLGNITLDETPTLLVRLEPASDWPADGAMPVIRVAPGTTTTARVRIERRNYDGRVNLGPEHALRNSPFGVYVGNIGLNGVLIPENDEERTFSIVVEPWVKPTERVVFMEADEAGRPVSNPVLLRVVSE